MRPLLAALFLLVASLSAQAHPMLQNILWVQFEADRIHVAVNVSSKEIAVAQQLESNGPVTDSVIQQAEEAHGRYLLDHLHFSAGVSSLAGKIVKITPPATIAEPEKTVHQYEIIYDVAEPRPEQVTVSEDMLREWPYAVGTAWDVSYIIRLRRWNSTENEAALLRNNAPTSLQTGWGSAAKPENPAPTTAATGTSTFRDYFRHGVWHILTGWDHLLFVSALVLATLNFWEMFKVIFAFTLAHTLTLTLSAFDILRLPSWIVEPTIALSIIFVALENVFWPRRAHSRTRLAVAFAFGLIHGLGFAGGLLDAMEGLPRIGLWIALAAFSLGVEVGHQVVVLPLFGALTLGRQRFHEPFARPAQRFGSVVISLCGAYYLAVAVHEQFFGH